MSGSRSRPARRTKARARPSCTARTSATTTTATATCCRRSNRSTGRRSSISEWFPQVYKDTHQQGSYGARITIPPKYDPINPHVDPLIWRTSQLLGGAMGTRARSRRRDRRRIAGPLRRVVHGVVPRRGEPVEHDELPHRERQRTADLAALHPPAADSARARAAVLRTRRR